MPATYNLIFNFSYLNSKGYFPIYIKFMLPQYPIPFPPEEIFHMEPFIWL